MADLKLDLFIKVMLMTTSTTDGEALAALRRANSMLSNSHIDWDKLLRGKVSVVADPFSSIPEVKSEPHQYANPAPPRKPQPRVFCADCTKDITGNIYPFQGKDRCRSCHIKATRAAPAPPSYGTFGTIPGHSTQPPQQGAVPGTKANAYNGNCSVCGTWVRAMSGTYVHGLVFCASCTPAHSQAKPRKAASQNWYNSPQGPGTKAPDPTKPLPKKKLATTDDLLDGLK